MKKLLILALLLFSAYQALPQADALSHFATFPAWYIGWDNLSTIPLDIQQNNTTTPANINFWTNGTQKMTVVGSSGVTDSYVGIGTVSPWNLLHLDATTPIDVYSQFTNSTTGNGSAIKGFLVGVDASGNAILHSNFNTGNMNFYTNGTQYMTILGTAGSAGYVGLAQSIQNNCLR